MNSVRAAHPWKVRCADAGVGSGCNRPAKYCGAWMRMQEQVARAAGLTGSGDGGNIPPERFAEGIK